MAYTAWSVVFGEQPTAAKWNQLGTNDAGFKDGTNFDNDLIKSKHIDWAATGGGDNGGIWWEELGRTTLGSAGDSISVASIASRKYLKLIFYTFATGGNITSFVRFNNDSGNNYAFLLSDSGGAPTNSVSQTGIPSIPDNSAPDGFSILDVVNVSSREKLVTGMGTRNGANGAANNVSAVRSISGKWANTSVPITRVDIVNAAGSGDFAIGSELVVLGHN